MVVDMGILTSVKVGRNFRITIPQKAREILDVEIGDELVIFTVDGYEGRICLRKK